MAAEYLNGDNIVKIAEFLPKPAPTGSRMQIDEHTMLVYDEIRLNALYRIIEFSLLGTVILK